MKKSIAALSCLLLPLGPLRADNIDSETVTIRYIEMPPVPLDGLDIASAKAVLALKDMAVVAKELATTTEDAGCNYVAQKMKLKNKYTNHYYKMTFSDPAPLMAVQSGDGKTLFADHFPGAMPAEDRFGTGCMSSQASLDKALKESNMVYNPESFKNAYVKKTSEALKKHLRTFLAPEIRKATFKLFTGKGPEYPDLQKALALSLGAYQRMGAGVAVSEKDKADLKEAIAIWDKALEEKDLNDKKARINKKLAVNLHHNVAMNAMVLQDFPKAIENLQAIKRIWAGASYSGLSVDPERDLKSAIARKQAYGLSPKTVQDVARLEAVAQEIKASSSKMPVTISRGEAYASLEQRIFARQKAAQESAGEALAKGASSNPFEAQVQHTAFQGYTLFLMPFTTPKYDALPKEICDLTHLNQLQMTSNTVAILPPEIGKLTNLKLLNLDGNKIAYLPPEIGGMKSLEKLSLAKNQLTSLPKEMGRLENLKVLDLRKNNIPPDEVAKIQGLLPNCKIKI